MLVNIAKKLSTYSMYSTTVGCKFTRQQRMPWKLERSMTTCFAFWPCFSRTLIDSLDTAAECSGLIDEPSCCTQVRPVIASLASQQMSLHQRPSPAGRNASFHQPRPALCEPHVIDVVLETIVSSAESLKGLPSAPPAFRLIACPLSHN